jgi:hypothetical protein
VPRLPRLVRQVLIKLCIVLWIGGGKAGAQGDNERSAVDSKRILERKSEASCGRTAEAVEILYCRSTDDLPEGNLRESGRAGEPDLPRVPSGGGEVRKRADG